MDPKEKKEMVLLIEEAIDKKVSPRFDGIDKRFDGIDKKLSDHDSRFNDIGKKLDTIGTSVEFIREQVAESSIDLTEMKEDLSDAKFTIERIETRLHTVVKDQDDIDLKAKQLNRRVLRLESKKAG